jgi:hypothetical protein
MSDFLLTAVRAGVRANVASSHRELEFYPQIPTSAAPITPAESPI